MTAKSRCAIGVDLGGTRIKAGVVDSRGTVLERRTLPTEADRGPDHVIKRINDTANELKHAVAASGYEPIGIGVGAPGALSQRRGIIMKPPNLPGWVEVPIAARVQAGVGLPALLENDANAAALGECWSGAGRGVQNLVMMTLGTGVGGGVVINGSILRGHFETAGELGHTIVQLDGRQCGCGQRGCLEAYSSASNIARRVVEAIEAGEQTICAKKLQQHGAIDAEDVANAVASGDAVASRIWSDACRYIALACVNVQHMLNPQLILLAGGLIASGERLLSPVREHFKSLTWKGIADTPEIGLAELGDDAGFVGAAAVVLNET